MTLLVDLLDECIRREATDLHLSVGHPPFFRIEGALLPAPDFSPVTHEQIGLIADGLIGGRDREPLTGKGALDGAFSHLDGSRFRFNVFKIQGDLAIAIRRLEQTFRPLCDLGLPESLYQLCDLSTGLVLLAGPTSSGKSTTLATLIDRINSTRQCHLITIEDPVEYIHKSCLSLVSQRQVGIDAPSFYDALVSALRQDPDVILVGEVRDLPTMRTAITAAETGHLVFATVHAGDTTGAIERVIAVFPGDEQEGIRRQLSFVLRAVIAQHLLPTCQEFGESSVYQGRRVIASEVLRITGAIANLIATGRTGQIYSAIETGTEKGMQTLEQNLAQLWIKGVISEVAALSVTRSPEILRNRAALLRKNQEGS